MRFLMVFLALVVAATAKPYFPLVTPQMASQQFGNQYGGQQHNIGSSGYGQGGQQMGGGQEFHNRGQHHKNFLQVTQGSESSAHDIGASSHFGSAGGQTGGFNNFNRGQSGYGQQGGSSFLQPGFGK